MIGSSTPLAEPEWHPVHRANAMLRAALLSSARASELSEDLPSVESLSRAIDSVMGGPVSITYPTSLAARLDALAVKDAFPAFEGLMTGAPLDEEAWDEGDDGFEDADELTVGAPLDPEMRVLPSQIHVQGLLREFQRRQRRASLLVAGSIATAVLLTVGGLVLAASMAPPRAANSDNRPPMRSTSVAWQRPANSPADVGLQRTTVAANRAAKSEPLLVPLADARSLPSGATPTQPQTILAASGRQIAFAPLLPPSPAGYLLIRGLPAEATLSAGRRSESGTWLVKGALVHDLMLSIGEAIPGDYPIEVYVLQSGDSPQARRNLVLRIEAPARTYAAAAPDAGWTSALLPSAHAAEETAVPAAAAAVLRERAKRLLDEGDIAAARLLLLHLAERGEGEAAYELARTFDREMLAALGAIGVDGDLAQARGWYQRASQDGNVKATERLKILASLSGTGPSD